MEEEFSEPPPRYITPSGRFRWPECGNLIVRALQEAGHPLTAKQIKRSLANYGQRGITMSTINRWLREDLQETVECSDGQWSLTGRKTGFF